eukprot:16443070-Heterocapsa_arctica.AAC.1
MRPRLSPCVTCATVTGCLLRKLSVSPLHLCPSSSKAPAMRSYASTAPLPRLTVRSAANLRSLSHDVAASHGLLPAATSMAALRCISLVGGIFVDRNWLLNWFEPLFELLPACRKPQYCNLVGLHADMHPPPGKGCTRRLEQKQP